MAFIQDVRHGESRIATGINHLITAMKDAALRRAVYNQTYSELSNLSDRDLNDLGIHRSQIAEVARAAADER